ncbi:MAG: hypothetical protein HGA66_17715, partial [Holophaga sp.]|nr:hypothetical protein [Holophaga sp.]
GPSFGPRIAEAVANATARLDTAPCSLVLSDFVDSRTGLTLDPAHGPLYLVEWGPGAPYGALHRSDLSGQNRVTPRTGFGRPLQLALDPLAGRLYWATYDPGTIQSVTLTGHDVHPGYSKGVMVNAVRVAAKLVELLPPDSLPETTEDRQPYLHPFSLTGDVTRAELKLLVRAFTEEELEGREEVLRKLQRDAEGSFPGVSIKLEIKESYRNMIYKIAEDPKVLDYALEAVTRQGITPIRRAIRGGTDGARLSYMGLPTPNIFAGGQSFHSVQEWVSLEWMAAAVEVCVQLLGVWVEKSGQDA